MIGLENTSPKVTHTNLYNYPTKALKDEGIKPHVKTVKGQLTGQTIVIKDKDGVTRTITAPGANSYNEENDAEDLELLGEYEEAILKSKCLMLQMSMP